MIYCRIKLGLNEWAPCASLRIAPAVSIRGRLLCAITLTILSICFGGRLVARAQETTSQDAVRVAEVAERSIAARSVDWETPDRLLEVLKQQDAEFVASLSVIVRESYPARPDVKAMAAFTMAQGRQALKRMREPALYQSPDNLRELHRPGIREGNEGRWHDRDANYHCIQDASPELYLQTPRQKTYTNFHELFIISPDNRIIERHLTSNSWQELNPLNDARFSYAMSEQMPMWALGRWYSPFISKIINVEADRDGMLTVTAELKDERNRSGKWQLMIDSSASYLVRSAELGFEGSETAIAIRGQGTIRHNGLIANERSERKMTRVANNVHWRTNIVSEAVSLKREFDEKLFDEVRRLVDPEVSELWQSTRGNVPLVK